MPDTQHFTFVLIEEFSHLAFSCAVEPLRIANLVADAQLYDWSLISQDGERATASNGVVSLVDGGFDAVPRCDRLFVLSGLNMRDHVTQPLLSMLRRQNRMGPAIGALCSGAWILAEAGFLDGHRAAIHWDFHDSFAEAFDRVDLLPSVFVGDGRFVTASGGTATADLMLHLIEQDHGADLSAAVADQMVYAGAREGDAAQRVSLQARHAMRNTHMAKAVTRMKETLDSPLSAAQIADELGISTRQLERLFGRYLNTSPKRYYMELRLDRARRLLIQTEASVVDVAVSCGFESAGHFARVYRAAFGHSPTEQGARSR